jgi:hypothetical protein
MDLRCKVFRAADAGALEQAINRFLAEELAPLGPVQFEEITQSESPSGVTVVLWYSRANEISDTLEESQDFEEGDELDGKELA